MMQKEPEQRPRIFDILKKPMLNDRAKKLLDSKLYSSEFAQTQIHGYDMRKKYRELKEAEKKGEMINDIEEKEMQEELEADENQPVVEVTRQDDQT